MTLMPSKKILIKAVFITLLCFCNMLTAGNRVYYRNFMRMSDQQIQTVQAVVIPLSESYFEPDSSVQNRDQIRDVLNQKLEQNPNITVILDCTDAMRIDSYCLLNINKMRNIKIIHAENITTIGYSFLSSCSSLTTLDLMPLSNVTTIKHFFLEDCSGLTTLDLTPLSNVTTIGNCFLSCCKRLTTLHLTPLSNVTTIGRSFLHNCSGLTHLAIAQNWRWEHRLPLNLKLILALQTAHIDPKRDGDDYRSVEYGAASSLMQGAEQSQDGYLERLEEVFSTARANKLLNDILNGEAHSSDLGHSDR
ncbi:MAG: hypothetical protein FADNKDHG_01576 [Holosporales bacterium]